MNALVTFSAPQIALIRRTVAKDCNQNEFDLFIELCKARGLNPLLRHCYAFVFSKNDAAKRQMVIVVSIEGQRVIAQRTSGYRPDERAPRFEIDATSKNAKTNPLGLISAEVTVYKHAHGEWHPVTEVAYWDELAPIVGSGDAAQLDPMKKAWRTMGRTMLAKCSEMKALRKAFPDDYSGIYGEGETDRAEMLDISPSEAADDAERQERLAKIGGANALIVDWLDGGELCRVPLGSFADQCMAFMKANIEEPGAVRTFEDRNRHVLREFWAKQGGDALELKKVMEQVIAGNGAEVFKKAQRQIGAAA